MVKYYGENWINYSNHQEMVGLNKVINSYLYFKSDSFDSVNALIKNNPNFLMAKFLKAFLMLLSRDTNKVSEVKRYLEDIKIPNSFDLKYSAFYSILIQWSNNNLIETNRQLLILLQSDPKDILVFRLYHFNQIFLGIDNKFLDLHKFIMSKWNVNDEHYNLILGMTSFALEENNEYAKAKKLALKSLELSNNDLWSWHALLHVLDSTQDLQLGLDPFKNEINWNMYGPMKRHLWWHQILFYYYSGDYNNCLLMYDKLLLSDDFLYLDFCNASSILIRLHLKGISVYKRSQNLKRYTEYYINQNSLLFIDYHLVIFCYYFDKIKLKYFESKEINLKYKKTNFFNNYIDVFKPFVKSLINNTNLDFKVLQNNFIEFGGSFAQRELIFIHMLNETKENFEYKKKLRNQITNKKNTIIKNYV